MLFITPASHIRTILFDLKIYVRSLMNPSSFHSHLILWVKLFYSLLDYLLFLGLNKEEIDQSLMLVTEPRFKQVIAGQLELVKADTEATQSTDNTLVFDNLGSSHTSCCLLVFVRPSSREVGWCLAITAD